MQVRREKVAEAVYPRLYMIALGALYWFFFFFEGESVMFRDKSGYF